MSVLAATMALSSCNARAATSIVLLVESDIEPTLLRRVELRVRWTDGGASSIQPRAYTIREAGTRGVLRNFPASVVVSPPEVSDGREMEFSFVAITDGTIPDTEAIFTQSRVRARFRVGESLQVPIFLADACGQSGVGARCTAGETCAVVAGSARCEPIGAVGETPFVADASAPVSEASTELRPLDGVVELMAGRDSTCARRERGPWLCWGEGSAGQLGNRRTDDSAYPATMFLGFTPVQLSMNNCHGCGLLGAAPSAIGCFGCNDTGQLGLAPSRVELAPVLSSRADWAAVTAGGSSTCALTGAGAAFCWGANDASQLGDGTRNNSFTPVAVSVVAGARLTQIASSTTHSCARTEDGHARCWGSNNQLQLGASEPGGLVLDSATPGGASATLGDVERVVVGDRHSCAVLTDHRVACWGATPQNGIFPAQRLPTAHVVTFNQVPVVLDSLSAAGGTTLGIDARGVPFCWGASDQKQCGPRHDPTYVSPYPIPLPQRAVRVVTGGSHACALLADRSVWCWGANYSGQLGRGTRSATPDPNAQPVLTDL